MRVSTEPVRPRFFLLLAGALLLTSGALLLTQRSGLCLEYFAGRMSASVEPVFRSVESPQLGSRDDVVGVLVSQEIFDLRWKGWLSVDRAGEYEFLIHADESSYLRLDQQEMARTDRVSRSAQSDPLYLEAGLHLVEIGFSQTGGGARLESRWSEVGGESKLLIGSDLVARRPARVRAVLQRWLDPVGSGRLPRALGGLAALTGLALIHRGLRPVQPSLERAAAGLRDWVRVASRHRAIQALFLLTLFLAAFLLILPYTASTTDGDDVRYMDGARFDKQMGWNMNRYAHIYVLKAFIWGAGGDAFQASRIYWAFSFGLVVVALAVAVRVLGPGLQLGSLGVAIFLLLAQPYLFGGIGAAYADYSAMMFVALGLAVYLHGYKTQALSPSNWHAVALGVLTVAAAKSKEPGLIMLWLALGLVWSEGRLDLRRFGRRLAWWTMGAAGAYLLLMTLDGWVLGDFWFSLRLESVAGAQRLKEAAEEIWQLPRWAWLTVAWTPGSLRTLSAVTLIGAVVALIRPWSPEFRWIAWMPVAFMAMMIAVHPAISSPRYLFPIVPVACFVGAMVIHDLSSGSAIWGGSHRVRSLGLAVCLLAFFGVGLSDTWGALARHRTVQRGDWTLYPWKVFRQEIEATRPREIVISPRLNRTYQMLGKSKTRDRIARLYFQRRYLRLRERRSLAQLPEMAVITRREFGRLLQAYPDLQDTAVFDPSGEIVLIRRD